MNNPTQLDILIVYTETLVSSASDFSTENTVPFPIGSRSASYTEVYGYFLEVCKRQGLRAGMSSSADVVGAGLCGSYWSVRNKVWVKNNTPCFSNLIFDKFSPTRSKILNRRKLLFSSKAVRSFNDPELFDIFFDKQLTYQRLAEHSIPTAMVRENTPEGASNALADLKSLLAKHPLADDFSNDYVMKDRFGAGGRHIYKIAATNIQRLHNIIQRNKKVSFIIQPFAKFDQGFVYGNKSASTDIRLIFLGGQIVQSYIRVAKQNDFRCNEHQGGSLIYLPIGDIPESLIVKANSIASKLRKTDSLFALDFIVSNNGNIYLLEGNTGPGLDWNVKLKRNELEAKKLIRLVVGELCGRTEQNGSRSKIKQTKIETTQKSKFAYLATT